MLKMDSTIVTEHSRLKCHASPISACASNSESIAATADVSGLILLHDAKDQYEKLLEIKNQGSFAVTDMVMNDKFVIASYCTGHIRFFRIETGNLATEIAAHARAITALDLLDNHLVSVGEDTFLNVWSIPDSEAKTIPNLPVVSSKWIVTFLHGKEFKSKSVLTSLTISLAVIALILTTFEGFQLSCPCRFARAGPVP